MCGVVEFQGSSLFAVQGSAKFELHQMAEHIVACGPDSDGYWFNADGQAGFGHRLAIMDLSTSDHQPMVAQSGRVVPVFDGEVCNHAELVLEPTVHSCTKIFAVAVWDRQAKPFSLVRTRLSERPPYYSRQCKGNTATFMFPLELNFIATGPKAVSLTTYHAPIEAQTSI